MRRATSLAKSTTLHLRVSTSGTHRLHRHGLSTAKHRASTARVKSPLKHDAVAPAGGKQTRTRSMFCFCRLTRHQVRHLRSSASSNVASSRRRDSRSRRRLAASPIAHRPSPARADARAHSRPRSAPSDELTSSASRRVGARPVASSSRRRRRARSNRRSANLAATPRA